MNEKNVEQIMHLWYSRDNCEIACEIYNWIIKFEVSWINDFFLNLIINIFIHLIKSTFFKIF